MYQGRTAAEAGLIFGRDFPTPIRQCCQYLCVFFWLLTSNRHQGHENMGIIHEVGSGVTLLKKGDRVVMPFNVADGRCLNCEEGNTAYCTGVNPGFAGGAYGVCVLQPNTP